MPLATCQNPKDTGTWLKTLDAVRGVHVLSSQSLPDSSLVWVRNGQNISYSKHEDAGDNKHVVLDLNLAGHSKLLAYAAHFPEIQTEEKTNLEHDWVFYPQTDNKYLSAGYAPDNTCNSSSCAMYLEYFLPAAIADDMEYVRAMYNAYFQSINHDHQTLMLERFGVKSTYRYNASWNDLIAETNRGYPSTVGFYHRGPDWAPRGGHVGLLIDADKWDVEMLDPYGNMLDGYTTSVQNGYRVVYPRNIFEPRWVGNGNGFMREFIDIVSPIM